MKAILAIALTTASPLALAAVNLSIAGLVELVIYLLVVGGIVWLLLWLIGYAGIPEPFSKVARVIIMIVAVLICINILLGFVGSPIVRMN